MSATFGAEPVTTGMKGWLEDRLHDLEHRLLNHPINDVGDMAGIMHLMQFVLGMVDEDELS